MPSETGCPLELDSPVLGLLSAGGAHLWLVDTPSAGVVRFTATVAAGTRLYIYDGPGTVPLETSVAEAEGSYTLAATTADAARLYLFVDNPTASDRAYALISAWTAARSAPATAPTPARPTPPPPSPGRDTVVLTDDFSDPARGVMTQSSPRPRDFSTAYVGGEYQVRKVNPGYDGVMIVPVPGNYSDVTVTADVRFVGPDTGRSVALYCRISGPDAAMSGYWITTFVDHGSVSMGRTDALRGGARLGDWFPQELRLGDAVNHLALTCIGDTIQFDVNGTRIFSITDSAYTSGEVRLGVVGGSNVEARFDNLVVTTR